METSQIRKIYLLSTAGLLLVAMMSLSLKSHAEALPSKKRALSSEFNEKIDKLKTQKIQLDKEINEQVTDDSEDVAAFIDAEVEWRSNYVGQSGHQPSSSFVPVPTDEEQVEAIHYDQFERVPNSKSAKKGIVSIKYEENKNTK